MHIHNYEIRVVGHDCAEENASLRSALTRHLLAWWRGFEEGLPTYGDFDIADHVAIADNVFLVKVIDDSQFDIRLCGEIVAEVVGLNTMGQVIHADGPSGSSVEREYVRLARYYRSIVTARKSYMCFGSLKNRYDLVKKFESVDCPLFSKDGSVEYIIGALVPLPNQYQHGRISLNQHIL